MSLLLLACVPVRQEPQVIIECPEDKDVVFEEIGELYVTDDEEMALSRLKTALNDPEIRCRAAFYLFFLDAKGQDRWIEILNSPDCSEGADLERVIVTDSIKSQSKSRRCKRDRKWLRLQLKKCKAEKEKLKKENEQLNFEIKKLEEIRRETERLRLE